MHGSGTGSLSYGDAPYWDERYAGDGPNAMFDWYQRYPTLAPLFALYFSTKSKILMVGCGNSELSEDMVNDGYTEIHNIDISPVVIAAMNHKYKNRPELTYTTMDVRSLKFEDLSFDVVVDKGTLDSILCGDNATVNSALMLSEVFRVLKPGGIYFLITYGDPRTRMSYLQKDFNWTVKLHVMPRPGTQDFDESGKMPWVLQPVFPSESGDLGEGRHWDDGDLHFVYVCIKGGGLGDHHYGETSLLMRPIMEKPQSITNIW